MYKIRIKCRAYYIVIADMHVCLVNFMVIHITNKCFIHYLTQLSNSINNRKAYNMHLLQIEMQINIIIVYL